MPDVRLVKYRGQWCASWPGPEGTVRRSLRLKPAADRGAAERALADFRRTIAVKSSDVAGIVEAYLDEKDLTADSPDRLRFAWKRLKPAFGHFRPDQVTRDLCRVYVADRRKAAAGDGTIRKELGTLRAALQWSDPKTPAVFELPPAPPPMDRHLTRAEFDKLLENADADHVKLFIMLALTTAGRKEAILELTWDRVDFEREVIRLGEGIRRTKGRATVPMHPDIVEPLKRAKKLALTDHVIEWAEKPVKSIRTGFARACERSGLADVSPHVLRHTAAVWLAESGIPIPAISQYLGHSDSRITERVYARFSPTYLKKAAASLSWKKKDVVED